MCGFHLHKSRSNPVAPAAILARDKLFSISVLLTVKATVYSFTLICALIMC